MEQLCTAEITKMQHPARTVNDKSQQQQPDQDDKNLAVAFGEILLHNRRRLLFEGFITRVQPEFLRRVPEKYAGHPRAFGTAVRRPEVLHFDFRARHNILSESVSSVRSIWRLGKCHRHVCDSRILRPRERLAHIRRKSRTKHRHMLSGSCENYGLRSKATRLALDFRLHLRSSGPLFDMQHSLSRQY